MIRKILVGLALLIVFAATIFFVFAPKWAEESMNRIDGEPLIEVSAEAEALNKTLTIVDLHSDTLMWDRDLNARVAEGRFREDLLARLNLWIFRLPGLKERREDVAPNLDYELKRHAETSGDMVTFNKEARERYLAFATSPEALWLANFRDLGASVTRMATLALSGRITEAIVMEEIERLKGRWQRDEPGSDTSEIERLIGRERLSEIDLFDQAQLAAVIRTCRQSRSLSEAGRMLFAVSRLAKSSSNDADRLKKYLARYGISWSDIADSA